MIAEMNVESNSKLMKKVNSGSPKLDKRDSLQLGKENQEEGVSFCYFFLVKQLLKQMQITLTKRKKVEQ